MGPSQAFSPPVMARILPPAQAWPIWAGLEEEQRARGEESVAASLGWNRAWVAHFGDLTGARVVVVQRGATPIGAVLLTRGHRRRSGGVPIRTLHLGTEGEPPGEGVHTPRLRLLARDGERPAVAQAIVDLTAADRTWDELRADRLDPRDAELLGAARPDLHAEALACLTVATPPADSPLDYLRSRLRKRVRRMIESGPGEATVELADGAAEAHAIVDELMRLSVAHWAARGLTSAFERPRFAAFIRDLVDELVPQGRLLVVRVRQGERTTGCATMLREADVALGYQAASRAPTGNSDAPGYAMHAFCMHTLAQLGVRTYDLLDGGHEYKQALADGQREMVSLAVRRDGHMRVRLADAARSARRRWRQRA
jgi:CelD/BcsL family acetyltransferase involved in cellulose biosynthesis